MVVQENVKHRSKGGKGKIPQQTALLKLYFASESMVNSDKWYKSGIKM